MLDGKAKQAGAGKTTAVDAAAGNQGAPGVVGKTTLTSQLDGSAGLDAAAPKAQTFAPGAPKDFATAKDRHRANLDLLKKLLDEGKDDKDSKWGKAYPNACQWLLAGKTTLHALTETHDSVARATRLGDATLRAFFGSKTPVPTMSSYDDTDQTKADNIELVDPSWLGYRSAGSPSKVVIVDPVTKDKELVKETITHEVQHDADHHGTSDFERYQTEFDAYWIDKSYGSKSPRTGSENPALAAADGTALTGFDNARQQAIFEHLYNSAAYAYVKTGWGNAAFKAKVLALKFPAGSNLINSARIDDLYLALTKSPPDVATAKTKLKALTDHDRAAIVSPALAGAWRGMIGALASAADQKFFKQALQL